MSLIAGAVVPCRRKAVVGFLSPAKTKCYSRGSFFLFLNMFSLVSFFRTFRLTRGKKAVLKHSLSQSWASCVPTGAQSCLPANTLIQGGLWFLLLRPPTVIRRPFCLSVPVYVYLAPSWLWIALSFPFWNEMRTQNTVWSSRYSQRSDATEMMCLFISSESSNLKLILRLFLET